MLQLWNKYNVQGESKVTPRFWEAMWLIFVLQSGAVISNKMELSNIMNVMPISGLMKTLPESGPDGTVQFNSSHAPQITQTLKLGAHERSCLLVKILYQFKN